MKPRIIAHLDFDGLISAHLLKQVYNQIKQVHFVTFREIKTGTFKTTDADIVADVPMPAKFAEWYDHHSGSKTYSKNKNVNWDNKCESCAKLIFKKHKKSLTKKGIPRLVQAANKIDTANFDDFDNPSPEEIISMTLLTNNNRSDREYKQLILTLLDNNQTLKTISQHQTVQERLAERKARITEEFKKIPKENITRRTKYGIKFMIFEEAPRIKLSKAAQFKLFTKKPIINYLITIKQNPVVRTQKMITITGNVYNKNLNPLNLKKVFNGHGKENTALIFADELTVPAEIESIITKLATLNKIA